MKIDAPLVSVIVRSIARPQLVDAIESILGQSYRDREVVVVDATGEGRVTRANLIPECRHRLVDKCVPLARGAAANAGLDAATGEYCIFLDDDDQFGPDHIATLLDRLRSQPDASLVYCGARVLRGEIAVGEINQPFSMIRLLDGNFITINAALFSRRLYSEKGCRFDETFDLYEDWDFWIQCAQHTTFVYLDSLGAIYRATLGTSGAGIGANGSSEAQTQAHRRVHEKWLSLRPVLSERVEQALRRGLDSYRAGDFVRAERDFGEVLGIDDRNVNGLNLLGMTLLKQGRPHAAVPLLARACAVCETVPGLFSNLGLAHQAVGRQGDAEVAFRKARQLEQSSADG